MQNHINQKFLNLADSLVTLLGHENNIMLQKGDLSIENYMGYKTALLQQFDEFIQNLPIEMLSDDAKDMVKSIQNVINLNTALQQAQSLHMSYQTTRLEEKIFQQTDNDKNNRIEICH